MADDEECDDDDEDVCSTDFDPSPAPPPPTPPPDPTPDPTPDPNPEPDPKGFVALRVASVDAPESEGEFGPLAGG